MCGRGDQSLTWADICELSGIIGAPTSNLQPCYNIAPTTTVHLVREKDGKRVIEKARWDLVPSWWKKPLSEKKFGTHNARAETILEKASFRAAWKKGQRCIIPMNFFEWKRPRKKGDPPFHIFPTKEPAFRMAGIWDEWTDPEAGEVVLTCTTITCEPNEFMAELHDRMPVILGKDQLDAWFNAPPEEAYEMLKPCPSDWMTANKVSAYVNNTRNQGPDCIEPEDEQPAETPEPKGAKPKTKTKTAKGAGKMCGRKKSYETEAKANKFGVSRGMYAYECPICHTWHLTKKKLDDDQGRLL